MKKRLGLFLVLVFFLSGCISQSTPVITPTQLPTQTETSIVIPTATVNPTATSVPLINGACSPLQGFALNNLNSIISNPYTDKYPFSEGPAGDKNHPAVDLGFYSTKPIPSYNGPELSTDDGLPIQALLPGKVVETVDNLFPYGNMVLVETPLDQLSPDLLAKLNIPDPYSQAELDNRFPCQKDQTTITWSVRSRSLYVLYAHMKSPSTLQKGDLVQCGEVVGAIGATGNSSESIEHLHLEIRVGPSDANFRTISDYISSATPDERYNYCIWALSEVFRSIDPALFWKSGT
jgi:murein DD-endopeptidase MepM/ murein hydrolase activator NlpD